MNEIRILSRGGQGAVTAAKILVGAAIKENLYAQAIPSFGQERKGAPVFTYARIDAFPILPHTYVYEPDTVVMFDSTLMDLGIMPEEGIKQGAVLVLNASGDIWSSGHAAVYRAFGRVGVLDAWSVTKECIGNVPPNAAMLGAFVRTTVLVGLDALLEAMAEALPERLVEKNQKCVQLAYERTVLHG